LRILPAVTLITALATMSLQPLLAATDAVKSFTLAGISSTGGSGTVTGYGTFDDVTGTLQSIVINVAGLSESGVGAKVGTAVYRVGKDQVTLMLSSSLTSSNRTDFVLNSPRGVYGGHITVTAAK